MASLFSWMDHSEAERRRTLDIVALFRDRNTRDELGIGVVRDAFADLLFPGTSTIQTRAKYFLCIPWTYTELERLRVPSPQIEWRARREETLLIGALMEGAAAAAGVIGSEVGQALKRLPSSVYWLGLKTWGIRSFAGSQAQYHRSLDRYYSWDPRRRTELRTDDGDPIGGRVPYNWDRKLPSRPAEFPRTASLQLTKEEAAYLKERITSSVPRSLLAWLVERDERIRRVNFPWLLADRTELPAALQEQLLHARNFSECMHGAAILYNFMLARQRKDEGLIEGYEVQLASWSAALAARSDGLRTWDRRRFWEIVRASAGRVTVPTRAFIDRWLGLVLDTHDVQHAAVGLAERPAARRLIEGRERAIKGERSRLANRRQLELWSGAAGMAQLSYRWPVAQQIIDDIVTPLTGGAVDA